MRTSSIPVVITCKGRKHFIKPVFLSPSFENNVRVGKPLKRPLLLIGKFQQKYNLKEHIIAYGIYLSLNIHYTPEETQAFSTPFSSKASCQFILTGNTQRL